MREVMTDYCTGQVGGFKGSRACVHKTSPERSSTFYPREGRGFGGVEKKDLTFIKHLL